MLGEALTSDLPKTLIIAVDAFGFAEDEVAAALQPLVSRLGRLIGATRNETMAPQGLSVWARAQRTLQPAEAWETFRPWVEATNPRMAFVVARNLIAGSQIPAADLAWAALMRREVRARLRTLVEGDAILCLPTTPFPAPLKGQPVTTLESVRNRITCLAAHGGLAGLPQVSIPGAKVNGLPVGFSIVGGHGKDAMLVSVARAMEDQS